MKSISLPKYLGGCSIDTLNVKEDVTIFFVKKKSPNASISEHGVGNTSLLIILV